MKNKKSDLLLAVLFCVYLLGILLLFLLQPKADFSAREKRYLAKAPRLSAGEVLSGSFGDAAESWCADHLPGRDFFVSVNAHVLRLANLQVTRPIYIGESGRLYERPVVNDPAVIRRNMEAINAFAESVGQDVDLMLVPSAGFLLREDIRGLADDYPDDEVIAAAEALAGEHVRPLPLLPVFQSAADPAALYYRTDHHWTSLGAYLATAAYAAGTGRELPAADSYIVTREEGFQGTTYARACFWELPPESLELWDSGGQFEVRFSDREGSFDRLFFRERLGEEDKYPVWLDGNHPLVRIRNLDPGAEGKLLVIRDSYANCMGCFLADAYREVVLADLRYYKQPLQDLCREEGFDRILVLYSVGNFMTDSNIVWLG